jgi:hypothetical protein
LTFVNIFKEDKDMCIREKLVSNRSGGTHIEKDYELVVDGVTAPYIMEEVGTVDGRRILGVNITTQACRFTHETGDVIADWGEYDDASDFLMSRGWLPPKLRFWRWWRRHNILIVHYSRKNSWNMWT